MTEQRINRLKNKIQQSRDRLMNMYPVLTDYLLEMIYVATKKVDRISTNGICIYFDPDWLQKLDDIGIDFILMHELMHIFYDHINRTDYYKGDRYHLACDVIVNANLFSLGWHYEKINNVGIIYYDTFFPKINGYNLLPEDAIHYIPIDPAELPKMQRRRYMIDSDMGWDLKEDRGEIGTIVLRPYEADWYNDSFKDTSGGYFTPKKKLECKEKYPLFVNENSQDENRNGPQHGKDWDKSTAGELEVLRGEKKGIVAGTDNRGYQRTWQKNVNKEINWRLLLDNFVQEEHTDYSFTPPDHRLTDLDFFLPDYSSKYNEHKEVLFMVDTSGSFNDNMLSAVYTEITSAVEQYESNLTGRICFFDVEVQSEYKFNRVSDLTNILPEGGGGTDFNCIFEYVHDHMSERPPSCIVILTDGEAIYPNEKAAENIPVLWLLTKKDVFPPWGQATYIEL